MWFNIHRNRCIYFINSAALIKQTFFNLIIKEIIIQRNFFQLLKKIGKKIKEIGIKRKKQKGKGKKCHNNYERVGRKLLAVGNIVHKRSP